MSIPPDQLAMIHGSVKEKPKKSEKKGGDPQSAKNAGIVEFHRNDFLNIQGSEIGTDRRIRPTGGQETEKVIITENLRAQVRSSLRNYISVLAEIQREDRTALDGQFHYHDRQLLATLVDREKGAATDEKINEWLGSNAKHWEEAIVTMEHHASRTLMALGVKAFLFPEGEKITRVDNQHIQLGIDQGCLNKVWNDTIAPFLTGRRDRTGGRPDPRARNNFPNTILGLGAAESVLAGTIFGLVLGGQTGGPVGAALGAGLPFATMGAMRMGREGVVLHTQRMSAAFQSILNDPQEVKFMSAATGINLANYDVVGGRIQLRANRQHEISKSPKYSMEEALKTLYTRQEFLSTVGASFKDLDEMSEQFLFMVQPPARLRENIVLMEQNGLKMQARVYREFLDSNGIRDRWGQMPNNPYFGRGDCRPALGLAAGALLPVPLPALVLPAGFPDFNPDHTDIAGNLQRWREARAKILEEDLKDEVNKARQKKTRAETMNALGVREKQLGTIETQKKQEYTDRKITLEADKTVLSDEKNTVDAYRKEVEKFREDREKKFIEARDKLSAALFSVVDAGGGLYADTPAALAALRQVLVDPVVPGAVVPGAMIDGQLIQSIPHRLVEARNARVPRARDVAGGETAEQYDRYLAGKEEDYKTTKAQIDEDAKLIGVKMKNLREAVSSSSVASPESLSETNKNVSAAIKVVSELQADYTTIAGWPGITEARLRTEPIDKLVQRINAANGAHRVDGWSKEQNTPVNRARLIRAMTEARARGINAVVGVPGPDFNMLTSRATAVAPVIRGWETAEHQLLTFSSDQIHELLNNRLATNPRFAGLVVPAADTIELVRDIARQRLLARSRAMEQMERDLTTQIEAEDTAVKMVDLKAVKERSVKAKAFMENQGSLLESARDIAASPETFFNTNLIDAADAALTPLERRRYAFTTNVAIPGVGGAPVVPVGTNVREQYNSGYLEFMNVIFKYREKGDRNSAFKEASEILSPDELATLLDRVVGMRLVPPIAAPRNNINAVFADARTLIDNGTIGWDHIQEALEEVSSRLANRALAEAA